MPKENLFPQAIPDRDMLAFDMQILSEYEDPHGLGSRPASFFFLVISGEPSEVQSLNKRDGSHIDFLSRGVDHIGDNEVRTAHFVCTDDSPTSNCDAMHIDGVEGTVVRMPNNMGFAKYAVAHAVRNLTDAEYELPHHIKRRILSGTRVQEMDYSYDFLRTKGKVNVRFDYSNDYKYYQEVVEPLYSSRSKRDLETRG